MGRVKELLINRQNGWEDKGLGGDLSAYAALLGGEVDGKFVRCRSPGRGADDRSCYVAISKGRPFIYDCEGSERAAYAYVRERLKSAPVTSGNDYAASALRIVGE